MIFSVGLILLLAGFILVYTEVNSPTPKRQRVLVPPIKYLTEEPEPVPAVVGVVAFALGILLMSISLIIVALHYLP
jgi:hypothetical protein